MKSVNFSTCVEMIVHTMQMQMQIYVMVTRPLRHLAKCLVRLISRLAKGAATSSPPARGSGERCELPSVALTAQRFSTHSGRP